MLIYLEIVGNGQFSLQNDDFRFECLISHGSFSFGVRSSSCLVVKSVFGEILSSQNEEPQKKSGVHLSTLTRVSASL